MLNYQTVLFDTYYSWKPMGNEWIYPMIKMNINGYDWLTFIESMDVVGHKWMKMSMDKAG